MPSIIPEFEYDIFISYRHKDNKGGHWVTEFVDALKTGLEATFKAQKNFETSASQNNDWAKAVLVHFYVKNGNKLQAQKLYDELTSPTRTEYSSQYILATAASFLGKKDLAHEHFKKAFEQRDNWLPYKINQHVRLPNDALSDPRNMALMKKNFPFMKERR